MSNEQPKDEWEAAEENLKALSIVSIYVMCGVSLVTNLLTKLANFNL